MNKFIFSNNEIDIILKSLIVYYKTYKDKKFLDLYLMIMEGDCLYE